MVKMVGMVEISSEPQKETLGRRAQGEVGV